MKNLLLERNQTQESYLEILTVEETIEAIENGNLSVTLFSNSIDIQRNKVWEKAEKTNYIDTIIRYQDGLSVIYVVDKEDCKELEDGKQKVSTVDEFVEDGFALGTLVWNGYNLTGKKFSELPEEIKERFLNAKLWFKVIPYESEEQVADIFVKLNSGEKLRHVEKLRAMIAKDIPSVQNIINTEYFVEVLKYTATPKKRFADAYLAIGLIMEDFNPGSDQNPKTKEVFANKLKDGLFVISDVFEKNMNKKFDYLTKVFSHMFVSKEDEKEVRKKVLANSNRVILHRLADICLEKEYCPENVYKFLHLYYIGKGNSYFTISGTTSTSNKSSLDLRFEDIVAELKKYMKKVKN